jgi:hypothetical protein
MCVCFNGVKNYPNGGGGGIYIALNMERAVEKSNLSFFCEHQMICWGSPDYLVNVKTSTYKN